MKIDKISEKIYGEYKKQELNRQEFLTEIMKPTNPYECKTRLEIELYEEIDKNYTESLERNDKLSMNRAKSELELATKMLDMVEKI